MKKENLENKFDACKLSETLRPSVFAIVRKMDDDKKIELWNSILRSRGSTTGYVYHLDTEGINDYFKGFTPFEIVTSFGDDFCVGDRYFGDNPADCNLGLISSYDVDSFFEDDLLVENIVMEFSLEELLEFLCENY